MPAELVPIGCSRESAVWVLVSIRAWHSCSGGSTFPGSVVTNSHMNALVLTFIPQAFIGSLPLWYYDVRIGWLGMTYLDRISMRWIDVAALGVLAVSGYFFFRQAQVAGAQFVVRLFRIAMLLSLALAACLSFAILLTFVLVPRVPASYPPATPGTWISLALNYAAPVTVAAAASSFLVTLFYVWSTRNHS